MAVAGMRFQIARCLIWWSLTTASGYVAASDIHVLVEVVVQFDYVSCVLQNGASQPLGQTLQILTRFDIASQQDQECGNHRICTLPSVNG